MHSRLSTMILLVFLIIPVYALGETADHLVINEIYVESEEPDNCWMEVYNPTADTLFLAALWAEGIKTSNLLPFEIEEVGGVAVAPKGYLVVCPYHFITSFYLEKTGQTQAEAIEAFRQKWNIPQEVSIIPGFHFATEGIIYIYGVTDRKYGVKGDDGRFLWAANGTKDDLWLGPRSAHSFNVDKLECAGEGLLAVWEGKWLYSRIQDGVDTNNSADFVNVTPTPGVSNKVASEVLPSAWGEIKD